MVTRTDRKKTGGKYIAARKKKAYEKKGQQRKVNLNKSSSEEKRKTWRVMGGNIKTSILKAKFVNILGKDKKMKKIEIKNVLETPSNKFLARQNIITKGTIIETELGKARVTSRPTQDGIVNGILVD